MHLAPLIVLAGMAALSVSASDRGTEVIVQDIDKSFVAVKKRSPEALRYNTTQSIVQPQARQKNTQRSSIRAIPIKLNPSAEGKNQ